MHDEEGGGHQGQRKLYRQLLSMGYYWPTMEKFSKEFVKKCYTCQIYKTF